MLCHFSRFHAQYGIFRAYGFHVKIVRVASLLYTSNSIRDAISAGGDRNLAKSWTEPRTSPSNRPHRLD